MGAAADALMTLLSPPKLTDSDATIARRWGAFFLVADFMADGRRSREALDYLVACQKVDRGQ